MPSILLSLCIITKDEATNLPRCLESVKDVVDEIILVDTGSSDRTIEIAENYGAEVHAIPWPGSFAAARNIGLDYAKGEWVLCLDADEALHPDDREAVRALLQNKTDEGLLVKILNFTGPAGRPNDIEVMTTVRLFRNRKEYRFQGLLHEQIAESILQNAPATVLRQTPVRVLHYGYLDGAAAKKDKSRRNLQLAEKAAKLYPQDAFIAFNLGVEYERVKEYGKAERQFRKAKRYANPKAMWASKLYKELTRTLIYREKWAEASKIAEAGEKLWPDYTDLVYLEGLIAMQNKNYARAIGCFSQCLVLGVPPTPPYAVAELGLGSYKAYYAMGEAYEAMGHLPDAIQSYQKAVQLNPGWVNPLLAAARLMLANAPAAEALAFLEKYYRLEKPDGLIALADLIAAAKAPKLALPYLARAVALAGETDQVCYLTGYCLAKTGEYEAAAEYLHKIDKASPYYRDAVLCLCFCLWSLDKIEDAKAMLASFGAGAVEYTILASLFKEEAKDVLRAGIKQFPDADCLKQKLAQYEAGDYTGA